MPADVKAAFFDSNVLLYLISDQIAKSRHLDAYLARGGTISVQVLNEITNVARRKHDLGVDQVRPFLDRLRKTLDVVPVTVAIHETGLELIERYKFATYDAMIVAAASHAGCDVILSEDMQHGMIVGGLRIINPFPVG